MKRFIMMFALLIAAAFLLTPVACAGKNYNTSKSNVAYEICVKPVCEGDIVGDQLILIGKDGRKHIAPDGRYTTDDGEVVQVIEGRVLKQEYQNVEGNGIEDEEAHISGLESIR